MQAGFVLAQPAAGTPRYHRPMVRVCMFAGAAAALLACGSDDTAETSGASGSGSGTDCPTAGPLTGSFDGEAFQPTAIRGIPMFWVESPSDTVMITARDHPLDCTSSGGLPTETWMEINIIIPKPVQAAGVHALDDSLSSDQGLPIVGAGRYVRLAEGGVSNHLFSGITGTLCISAIDASHVAGRLEVHESKVELTGEFDAEICTPADGGL